MFLYVGKSYELTYCSIGVFLAGCVPSKMAKITYAPSIYSKTENFLSFSIFFASWETVDLGKSKHADFNGPPFQRNFFLKFTPHWPPGVLWGPLRGPSSEKFWGNFIWCERPLMVEHISIKKPFVAISSRLKHLLTRLKEGMILKKLREEKNIMLCHVMQANVVGWFEPSLANMHVLHCSTTFLNAILILNED